jgi:uncharacterized linocin/CFP29 family protein
MSQAKVESGRGVMATGKWATEQLIRALKAGQEMGPQVLRDAAPLQKDEWIQLDTVVLEEAQIRLKGVADLMAKGLTKPVANAMGTTLFQWEDVTDMDPALISMSGLARTPNDRPDFGLNSLPLPLIHKDFDLNLRHLEASRKRGDGLDTFQARVASRLVAEGLERILFQGGPQFGTSQIYGYTTHPNRNVLDYVPAGELWTNALHNGEDILADVIRMKAAAEAARMYGPYILYIPSNYSNVLDADFKAASDKTIRRRLEELDGIEAVTTCDQMPADEVVLVQMTEDVTCLLDGEGVQTVQWEILGGFLLQFKVFCIQIPLIRSDPQGRSGVVHLRHV